MNNALSYNALDSILDIMLKKGPSDASDALEELLYELNKTVPAPTERAPSNAELREQFVELAAKMAVHSHAAQTDVAKVRRVVSVLKVVLFDLED